MKFTSSKSFFVLCLIFVHFLALTIAQTDLLYSKCVVENGNYINGSTYQSNLDHLLTSFYTNTSIDYRFYNSSYGEEPDQGFAIAQCRPDMNSDVCGECIRNLSPKLTKTCSNVIEAIGGYEYEDYNYCMLRYANRSIFHQMENAPYFFVSREENITEDVDGFIKARKSLLDRLVSPAAAGDSTNKSASGEETSSGLTIYAYVQCTPDISEANCKSCLNYAIALLPDCCNTNKGGRVITPSCNFRYELTPILRGTPAAPGQPITPPKGAPPAPSTTPPKGAPPAPSTTPPKGAPPAPSTTRSTPGQPTNTTPPNGAAPAPSTTPSKANIPRTVIIVVSVVIPVILIICIYIFLRARKPAEEITNVDAIRSVESLQFEFSTIRDATNNFSDANKLGQGGFGAVYKGTLPSGQDIAVKRLSRNSKQGDLEFKNEVSLLARLQHRNLVRLLGFCLERKEWHRNLLRLLGFCLDRKERLLVYEFLPNKSFDHFIFDPIEREHMNWEMRYKIIGGIARGLLYLHEDSRLRIIHRDLKASNILLDSEMNPKISDFGMARLFEMDESQGDTDRIVGTLGYMAPEYVTRGHFSVKSDVFSFGVLVLEIVSGQKRNCFHIGEVEDDLLTYAWETRNEGTAFNLADPTLRDSSRSEIIRCINIALLCVQDDVADRPNMAEVVIMLSSNLPLPAPSRPAFLVHGSVIPETSSSSSLNSTSRLTESNQSKRESIQWSKNEVSITELYPR